MKLSDWAKEQGIGYRTAWNLFKAGKIPNSYKLGSGTIIVPSKPEESLRTEKTVIYARVSSSENKDNLNSQAERVAQFCNAKGWIVSGIVKECASGLNDDRPKLQAILKDKTITRVVVEHKDRLTRFGFRYIETLFPGEIIVINQMDGNEKDLMQDFVSLVTSFCARLYGHRQSKRKTEKLIEDLKNEI